MHEDDPATETRIRAERHNLRRFEITTAPAEREKGTTVSIVLFNEAAGKQLEQDSLIDTLSAEFAIYVPIMDDLAAFTGDFVLDIDRAWDLVHDFTHTWAADPLGEWCEL